MLEAVIRLSTYNSKSLQSNKMYIETFQYRNSFENDKADEHGCQLLQHKGLTSQKSSILIEFFRKLYNIFFTHGFIKIRPLL